MITPAERDDFARALNRFCSKADALLAGNESSATITVNAGGVGIWFCAAACVAILVAVLVGSVIGGMWLSREAQRIEERAAEQEVKIDRANVLLSATWQHVPEVAEKIKQEHPEESADAQR